MRTTVLHAATLRTKQWWRRRVDGLHRLSEDNRNMIEKAIHLRVPSSRILLSVCFRTFPKFLPILAVFPPDSPLHEIAPRQRLG